MRDRIVNLGGGTASAMSLLQLTEWCAERFGPHPVASDPAPRAFDIPWIVLDASRAAQVWNWRPRTPLLAILEEIAAHAGRASRLARAIGAARMSPALFSVVIPARDEEESLPATLRELYAELSRESVPHEIVVVDDGSRDATWSVLQSLAKEIPTLAPVAQPGPERLRPGRDLRPRPGEGRRRGDHDGRRLRPARRRGPLLAPPLRGPRVRLRQPLPAQGRTSSTTRASSCWSTGWRTCSSG